MGGTTFDINGLFHERALFHSFGGKKYPEKNLRKCVFKLEKKAVCSKKRNSFAILYNFVKN